MSVIRRARMEDISRLAEIEVFNYRLNFFPIFLNDRYYFDTLQVLCEAEKYEKNRELLDHTFVYDDGVVKGFARVDGDELKKLFVEPVLHGQGIGSQLLQYAIEEKDVHALWALEKNTRAISLYQRHGFHVTGERMPVDDTKEYLLRLAR